MTDLALLRLNISYNECNELKSTFSKFQKLLQILGVLS